MLREYFGDWRGAQLGARRFAILWGILFALMLLVLLVAVILIISLSATNQETETWSTANRAVIGIAVAFMPLVVAMFNISVKRGRDIGIPGYAVGIVFLVLLFVGTTGVLASAFLALCPSDVFGNPSRKNG